MTIMRYSWLFYLMQLDFAFLAQFADFLESDGKLAAWGIGIDAVEASGVPFQAPSMCLVARLLLDPEEDETGHRYAVTVSNPTGEEKRLCEDQDLLTKHHEAGRPSGCNLVVSLTMIYSSAGLYQFRLVADGTELNAVRLFGPKSLTRFGDPNPRGAQHWSSHRMNTSPPVAIWWYSS